MLCLNQLCESYSDCCSTRRSAAGITTHRKGFSMGAILTGGNTLKYIGVTASVIGVTASVIGVTASVSRCLHKETRIYKTLQIWATYFCIAVLWGCAGKEMPTQVHVDETPEPLQEAQPVPVVSQEGFDIAVYLDDPNTFPLDAANAIIWARNQWDGVIVEGLPDIPSSAYSHLTMIPSVGKIDDLLVQFVWKGTREDRPNAVATTYMTISRRPPKDGGLPFYAEVWLYESFKSLSQWEQRVVILHEFGHAFGFSEVYMEKHLETISGIRYYTGGHAVKGYREVLYAMGERLAFAIPNLHVPMELETTHWKYPEMDWDVMQPYIAGQNNITLVTLGVLLDLGYIVDVSKAQMPNPTLTKPAIGQPVFKHDHSHIHLVLPEGSGK